MAFEIAVGAEMFFAPAPNLSERRQAVVAETVVEQVATEPIDVEDAQTAVDAAYKFTPIVGAEAHPRRLVVIDAEGVSEKSTAKAKEKASPFAGLKHRAARAEDIDELVEVDLIAFRNVNKFSGKTDEELRVELKEKFTQRFDKLGGQWIRLAERDNKIVGFITLCPTNKEPKDFESWEKTTNNGTLEGTFDSKGKNVYVVSLSMLPKQGEAARNMLFSHQIGEIIKGGYERAFFESRLPGLRYWMRKHMPEGVRKPEDLSSEKQLELATEYYNKTELVDGKELPYDKLLRIYHSVGCRMTKLVPDAYKDVQSMNFGAVCVLENPTPTAVRRNPILRRIVGGALQLVSHSPRLMDKMYQEKDEMKRPTTEIVQNEEQLAEGPGWWKHVKELAGRHKGKIALGAAATSLALTFATSPLGAIEHDAVDAWPWAIAAAGTDATMIAGLGMMAASVGSDMWKHPLKIRSRLPELAERANGSKLFETGFWVNTAAALGTSAVMIAGIVEALPSDALGTVGFPLLDAAATVTLRAVVRAGIKNNLSPQPSDVPVLPESSPTSAEMPQQFPQQAA